MGGFYGQINNMMVEIFSNHQTLYLYHKPLPNMIKALTTLAFSIIALISCALQPSATSGQEIVFKNVTLVPMDKERLIENQDVLVKNGLVAAIGQSGKVKYSEQTLVVDGKGKYLMPGLAEMHAHVPPVDNLEPMKEVLLLFAANGITTIRGMLGHPLHLELRRQLRSGELLGPRFYTSGPSFSGNSVKTPHAAAEMVRNQKNAGYDFLKLHPGITKENFDAITKTAHEVKIPFAGHVSYDVGVWRAIDAGYASIDHLDGFVESLVPRLDTIGEKKAGLFAMYVARYADTAGIPKLMTALRENNIWVAPTQALAERWFAADKTAEDLSQKPEMIYVDPKTLANWTKTKKDLMSHPQYDPADIESYIQLRRKLISECNKNGVGLLLASDAPQVFNVPGFSTHQELQYLVDAGLTPYDALRSGTVNPARYFNLNNSGVIKQGAVSDLLLLNGNPLKDISQTQNIAGVMLGKNWLSRNELDAMLKKAEKRGE